MTRTTGTATEQLRAIFERCGYVRRQSAEQYEALGHDVYKKGSEVRLVLEDEDEVEQVQSLLRAVGLTPGKPFRKHSRLVVPIYSAESVQWFLQGIRGSPRASGFGRDGTRIVRRPGRRGEGV